MEEFVKDILVDDTVRVQIKEAIWKECRLILLNDNEVVFEDLVYGHIVFSSEPCTITKIKPKEEKDEEISN